MPKTSKPVLMRTANDGRRELSINRALILLQQHKGWSTRNALLALATSDNQGRIQLTDNTAIWLLS